MFFLILLLKNSNFYSKIFIKPNLKIVKNKYCYKIPNFDKN